MQYRFSAAWWGLFIALSGSQGLCADLPMNSNQGEPARSTTLNEGLQNNADVRMLDIPGGKLLAMYRAATTPRISGAVILIPDFHRQPDWPGAIRQLFEQLPPVSWSTIAITPPDIDLHLNRSPPTDEDWKNAAAQLQARVDVALSFLREQKVLNVILIVQGQTSMVAAKAYAAGLPSGVVAMAMLAPQRSASTDDPIAQAISQLKQPLLEVLPDSIDPPELKSHAAAAQRAHAPWRRLLIPAHDADFSDNTSLLIKSVRGWLVHFTGQEIKPS